MRTVYLASPLSGDVEANQRYAREVMLDSLRKGEAPFVPHLLYTQVLDDTTPAGRELGMRAGAAMLVQCDALVAYIDRGISPGMHAEIEHAREHGIRVETRRLPLLDAEVQLMAHAPCYACKGSGYADYAAVACPVCKGAAR